ncbi:MAG: hypothetical protein AAGD96_15900, partial [Chloroflexota bacterium]
SFNPLFIGASGTAMSEPAFLFFSLLVLILLQNMQQNEISAGFNWRFFGWGLLVLALALFSMLVRTVGVSILITAVISLIPRKRWGIVTLAGSILAILLWILARYSPEALLLSPTYTGHVEYLSGELGYYLSFWEHLPNFDWPLIGNVMLPILELNLEFIPFWGNLAAGLAITFVVLTLIGWCITVFEDFQATEMYFILFLVVYYFWTAYIFEVQQRQLIPVIPFIAFYLVRLVYWLSAKVNKKSWQLIPRAAITLLLALLLSRNIFDWANPISERVVDYAVAGVWMQQNTPKDAIYAVNYPEPSYLYTRRSTEYLPSNLSQNRFEEYIAEKGISYLVIQPEVFDWHTGEAQINQAVEQRLIPQLNQKPEKYRLVFEDSVKKVSIYEVLEN